MRAGPGPLLVLLTAALAAEDAPAPPATPLQLDQPVPAYDPHQGMDADGRIPKVPLPVDLDHPERWRYVPEGRLKPGNVLQRFMVSSFVTPILYFEEAVGAGGGVAVTDIDFREQRRSEFAGMFASRTTEGQERYSMIWQRWLDHRDVPGGGVVTEERNWLRGVVAYDRTLTQRFFGLGADTRAGDETSYTDESGLVELLMQKALPHAGSDWLAAAGLRGEHHNLYRGYVPGRPTTGDIYPGLVADGDGRDSLWVDAALSYDTRDSDANPYRGLLVEASVAAAPWQQGGAEPGTRRGAIWGARASYAVPLPPLFHDGGDAGEENPPTDVLAIGAQVRWTSGDLPFNQLPSLGGRDTLRGYIGGRFTDRAAWHLSAEYRLWVIPRGAAITDTIRIERFGIAPFYELGSVAGDLDGLRSSSIHDSYGLSFRAELERTVLFRFDVGRSRDGIAFNFAYGLSF
jgi:hypothetical protein